MERYYERHDPFKTDQETKSEEILQFEEDSFRLILGTVDPWSSDQLILFNHGTFVGSFPVFALEMPYILCVDVKEDLFDLQISREDIIPNERWLNFLSKVFDSLFDAMGNQLLPDKREIYLRIISIMVSKRIIPPEIEMDDLDTELKKYPFFRSLANNVLFPIMSQQGLEFQKLDNRGLVKIIYWASEG